MRTLRYTAVVGLTLLTALASSVASAASYSISQGDTLSIFVYRQDNMNVRVRVDNSGYIRFPMAGRILVANRSTDEIEKVITRALKQSGFAAPEVVVSVEEFAPRKVYVLGETSSHSSMACEIPQGGEISAMQAISMAGGLADSANVDGIIVRRFSGNKAVNIQVPAKEILSGKKVADVELRPFDTVVIPKARAISVLGTVNKSGEFYAPPDNPLTVSRAITLAGGVSRPKSLEQIRVLRGDQFFKVDIRTLLEEGKGGNDLTLEPGDIVYVPETRW